jgi:hypothetical protein
MPSFQDQGSESAMSIALRQLEKGEGSHGYIENGVLCRVVARWLTMSVVDEAGRAIGL